MKCFVLLIYGMCMTTTCFAQEITVPLKFYFADKDSKYFSSMMEPTKKMEDLSGFRNVPAKPDMKAVYSVTACSGDDGEGVFYVYVGLDKELGEKYIIVDSNGNMDFGDDEKHTFTLDVYDKYSDCRETMDMGIFVPVRIDRPEAEAEYKNTHVQINPYQTYDRHTDKDDEMLDFLPLTAYFHRDTVVINVKEIIITATNSKMPIIPEALLLPGTRFNFIEKDVYFNSKDYSIGDTLIIAGKKLHLSRLENNILYINDLGHYAYSSKVGSRLPALFARDPDNNTRRLLNRDFENKFVLIDFWGSWCGPCIAALPELAELYEEIKDRDDVMIVGIAMEANETGVQEMKNIMDEKGVAWPNYWQERSKLNSPDSPTGKLGINAFPSHVIIDKSGKIVFSSMEMDYDQKNGVDFFRKLILPIINNVE